MTQEDPLAIIAYDIGVLPLIRDIQGAHPHVTQLCYADYVGAGRELRRVFEHFQDLQAREVPQGYFL